MFFIQIRLKKKRSDRVDALSSFIKGVVISAIFYLFLYIFVYLRVHTQFTFQIAKKLFCPFSHLFSIFIYSYFFFHNYIKKKLGKWAEVPETPVVIGFAACPLFKKKWALPTLKVGNFPILTICSYFAHFLPGQSPKVATKVGRAIPQFFQYFVTFLPHFIINNSSYKTPLLTPSN